ncbi:MAG: sigma-70 family RNA polymerase sigma factor [Armatimonadota bacterium]
MSEEFEQVWESHCSHVRLVLLSIACDVDIVEDCLQETYLKARAGFSSYRGEGLHSWLATIARNVYYSYARRKYFNSEESLDKIDNYPSTEIGVGSDDYLSLLVIREAISTLQPELRQALIMKHYGGCDYRDIGNYLSCTPNIAKHRVWRAMCKVRDMIGWDKTYAVECNELSGLKVLDWLYNSLPAHEMEEIKSHIKFCPSCRKVLSEFRRLSRLLDTIEGDYRILTLVELDEHGHTTRYAWVKHINEHHDPLYTWRWLMWNDWSVEYLALQSEPAQIHWLAKPAPAGLRRLEGDLPNPVPMGGMVEAMYVACPPFGSHWNAHKRDDGSWHYHHKHSPFPKSQGLLVVTLRLPKGAKLIGVNPSPQKHTTSGGRTSLTWRAMLEPIELINGDDSRWQFEVHLDYRL